MKNKIEPGNICLRVGNSLIGRNKPVFIVAEAGSNHNRRLDYAYKLIDAAVKAGADAVKFQLFHPEKLYPRKAQVADYLAKNYSNIYDLVKSMKMPDEWAHKLSRYCKEKKIKFVCSAFDEKAVDILSDAKIDAFKIASSEANHHKLIKYISRRQKPIIMSTGLCSLEEIRESVDLIINVNKKLALLYCAVSYPAQIKNVNLRFMNILEKEFDLPVGLSDHSEDPCLVPAIATALGAVIVEKHFTLDKKLPGPDHGFALDPVELKQMVKSIRLTENALIKNEWKLEKCEEKLARVTKRAVQAKKKILKGEILNSRNMIIIRPGKGPSRGLEPKYYDLLLGKKAKCDIEEGEGIVWVKVIE